MIGKKLRELIKLRNMKQIKLAKYVGISPSRLSNYLSDKREPDLEMLAKMAKCLSVDLNYFSDVRFVPKKSSAYAVVEEEAMALGESVATYNAGADDLDIVNIAVSPINAKKRAVKNISVPVSKMFLSNVEQPNENAFLFEVTTNIGGESFTPGDYVLVSKFNAVKPANGCRVVGSGRNGKCYKYLEDHNMRLLVDENQEMTFIDDNFDLDSIYVVLWVFRRCCQASAF